MPRIDQETVRKILDTADIVEVVSDFVKLKRSGANYMGLCPFHNERTPSFSVSKAKGVCKCFSCGKGGTPVGFIMEHEQLSYAEALRWLANKYNIEIKERELTAEEIAQASERESMLALNEFALQFFENKLFESDEGRAIGLSYFRNRGLTDAAIKRFRLGYSPEARDALASEAMKKGYSPELLASTGLCSRNDRGNLYDRFRGRVLFPVFTLSGKVVAFGGRTLKSDKTIAKYVNSPESSIYHKSSELYGLYQARRAIVQKNKCILVEGYMDVISMSQRGVENVVASSGTSLTDGQIALIHRFTQNVTVIYDSDPAGIKASLRGIDMLLAQGLNVKVLLLPEGDDPDSFAKAHSLEEIEAYMQANETDFIRFKTKILLDGLAANDPVARAGVINSIAKSISVIPDRVIRSEYTKECSRLMQTDEEIVTLQVAKYANENAEKSQTTKIPETSQEHTKEPTVVTRPTGRAVTDRLAYLRPAEMEVARLLVRYGLLTVAQVVDSEGEVRDLSVLDYVVNEFNSDDISFANPDLAKIFLSIQALSQAWDLELPVAMAQADSEARKYLDEARAGILAAGSVDAIRRKEEEANAAAEEIRRSAIAMASERFLTRALGADPDPQVRTLTTSFVSEKYSLSKIHTKGTHVPSERELLANKVPKAVYGLKIATLQWREKELRAGLVGLSGDEAAAVLSQLQQIREIIAQLAHYLGERIVLPK
ncbi:MAG: DNA primase [Bacteroidales bacterium]|nr:DNA primase [Bacteroidales bacterium]